MSGLPIILESDDGSLFATLDLRGLRDWCLAEGMDRVVFSGGDFGPSSWSHFAPEHAANIIGHFEAYCIANKKRPSFYRWCRKLVASNLAMTLRNLAIDSIEDEWRGKYLKKYEMEERE